MATGLALSILTLGATPAAAEDRRMPSPKPTCAACSTTKYSGPARAATKPEPRAQLAPTGVSQGLSIAALFVAAGGGMVIIGRRRPSAA